MRISLFIFLSVLPYCRHCEPEIFDMGMIPGSVLDAIPYQEGDTLKLKHSHGKVINFHVRRSLEKLEENYCFDCCDTYLFEEDRTVLTPDHPIFDCKITINNLDTVIYFARISVGRSYYEVPMNNDTLDFYPVTDSVKIGNQFYYRVYGLADQFSYIVQNDLEEMVRIDSLYFNFTDGILKITMTNEEYYQVPD